MLDLARIRVDGFPEAVILVERTQDAWDRIACVFETSSDALSDRAEQLAVTSIGWTELTLIQRYVAEANAKAIAKKLQED